MNVGLINISSILRLTVNCYLLIMQHYERLCEEKIILIKIILIVYTIHSQKIAKNTCL